MIRKLVVVLLTGVICLLGTASALAVKYNEAPMLKVKVAAGELPPVEERLPKEPLVLPVKHAIGVYGGTWITVDERIQPLKGYGVGFGCGRTLLFFSEGLRGDKWGTIIPNIAKDFKVNENKTRFTIYLREGLRWSDGYPYTTEDIEFWYNDFLLNKDLNPVMPSHFKAGEEVVKLKILDDYTCEFEFAEPQLDFLYYLAINFKTLEMCATPKHYMQQFHESYVDKEKLEALVKSEGVDTWVSLYGKKLDMKLTSNTEKPRLVPWIPAKVSPNPHPWYYERNPYYWAVDEEGKQLPYMDRISHEKLEPDVRDLRCIGGASGLALKHAVIPDLKEADGKGITQLRLIGHVLDTQQEVLLNQTYEKDPVLRDIFRDKRFRYAVSHAIDRPRMDKIVIFGMGLAKPAQPMPVGGPLYDEKLAKNATEYDPDRANALLDEMGLNKKNSAGYRLRSDGKPVEFTLLFYAPEWETIAELVADDLNQVGLKVSFKKVESGYFWESVSTNEIAAVTIGGSPIGSKLGRCDAWAPTGERIQPWAPLYSIWHRTNGKDGEQPTGDYLKVLELYDQSQKELDEQKRLALQKEIIRIGNENLWVIGTIEILPLPVVYSVGMRNIPDDGDQHFADGVFTDLFRPETYFFEK